MRMLIEKHAAAATYVSSGAAVIFGLSATDFAAIVGAGVAILTFAVNLYFKIKADKRAEKNGKCVEE